MLQQFPEGHCYPFVHLQLQVIVLEMLLLHLQGLLNRLNRQTHHPRKDNYQDLLKFQLHIRYQNNQDQNQFQPIQYYLCIQGVFYLWLLLLGFHNPKLLHCLQVGNFTFLWYRLGIFCWAGTKLFFPVGWYAASHLQSHIHILFFTCLF